MAEVNETMLTVRASSNDNATKPTFRFYWGDGAVTQESFSNTAYHMYHFIGIYTLHVQAWSLCSTSTLSENANISVPTPVRILKNISLQGEATVFGKTTQFRLLVGQGSHFECFWLLGDHVNATTASNDSRTIVLKHTYSAPANYTVHATCKNRRSVIAVNKTFAVQNVIEGLRIYPIPPILYGTAFHLRWEIKHGTDVMYKGHFSDIPLKVLRKPEEELYGEAWVTQQEYKTTGEFVVHIAASNAVTKWITVSVKCNIYQAVSPFRPVVSHKDRDIEINETITIRLTDVNSGLEINASYLVNFGDNSEVVVTREMSVNHSYGLHGLYTLNITAINEVSSFNTSIHIKVHKPVLKLVGASIPSLVAKLNQSVSITIFLLHGSDFVCHWEFGDGQELRQNFEDELIYFRDLDVSTRAFTNISVSTRHVFKQVAVYLVTAICQNRLSKVTAMAHVTVQKEIELFHVSPIRPVIFGKAFSVNWTIATGTNVTFKAFLNQQDLHVENHYLYYLSQITPGIYKQAGKYNITVTATNLVTPLQRHTQMVSIEIQVSEVHINMSYLEAGILHVGHGIDMHIFPEGVPVVFEATTDNGSSLEYTWSISEATEQFKHKMIEYTFNTPGIYTATIRVENQLSRAISSVVIAVQKRASFLHYGIECSSPKVKKETVTIRTTVEFLGTNSTLIIEVDNNTSYWYGDPKNNLNTTKNDRTMQYRGELKSTTILRHVFGTQGVYNITAILGNDVSRSSVNCEVEILSRPCKKPEVKLKGVGKFTKNARHFIADAVIDIEADIEVFCPESKESTYEWNVFQFHQKTGFYKQFGDILSNGEGSMQELRLKRRALPLGLFRLSLNVSMVGEDLQDFSAVAEGYIRIVQSDLVATISGGSEIRRRFGSLLSADGLESYDPDVGPGNYSGICGSLLDNSLT